MNSIDHKPIFSVVIATFNAEKYLSRCLSSVTSQTFSRYEIVVIDGGSSDATVEIISSYKEKISYWISEPDGGIYAAWNKALLHTQGEWVCFLGADDYFCDMNVLENLNISILGVSEEMKVVYGNLLIVDESEKTLKNVGRPWPMAKQRFFEVMTIPHPGMMHHRSLFSEVGNFDETFKIAGDYDLLLRYLCSHDAIYIPSVNVACMTYGGISTSSNNVRLKYKEVIKAREKIGLRKKTMFMRFYWSRATVRAILEELLGRKVTNTLADACRLLVGRKRVWTRT